MAALQGYSEILVVQRLIKTGCIPAGIEWMLRYLKTPGVNFDGFQERHDLEAQKVEKNSFYSVRTHVECEIPNIEFSDNPFSSGREKIEFIKGLIEKSRPCLISLLKDDGSCCHIVPVVEIDDENMIVLRMDDKETVEEQKRSRLLSDIEQIHDENLKSGKGLDILFVK